MEVGTDYLYSSGVSLILSWVKNMTRLIDLTDHKFGGLTVSRRGPNVRTQAGWVCFCYCGKESLVSGENLRRGNTRSCGCQEGFRTHSLSYTNGYRVWSNMMHRCYNEKDIGYHNYGGRGIKVCKRWHDVELFILDMGQPPLGLTIERKNNDRGYFPKNCCWATRKV